MRARRLIGSDGGLLIGIDLKKDPAVLHAAYNDAAGVTAAFNRNLLVRLNRELNGSFDLRLFHHYAFYNPRAGRIEMHLISRRRQRVRVSDESFLFARGETIHTESSYKYTVRGFHELAQAAELAPRQLWTDARRWFALMYLEPLTGAAMTIR